MAKKIAIIGAGIAGLVAGYELKKKGFEVVVFESSNRVGGRMSTDKVDGFLIDRGAQFLSENYSTLIPLIKELGLESELVESSSFASVIRNQKVCQFSVNNPLSPLTSGYLTFTEIIKFVFSSVKWFRQISKLPLDDYSAWAHLDDQISSDFILKEFNKTTLEYIIEPQMQGYYYQSPEESSKALALMLLSFSEKKGKVLNLKNGMGSLPEKLASLLNVQLNTSVLKVEDNNGRVVLSTNTQTYDFDFVVLACPAPIAKNIYSSKSEIEQKLLNTEYSSTVNVGTLLKEKINNIAINKSYGVLFPRKERQVISAIGIESNKHPARVPEGKELLDIMLDGTHGKEFLEKTEEEILGIITPEVCKFIPEFQTQSLKHHFIKWRYAEPKSPVGRSKLIKSYRESLTKDSKIVLAGDYLGFPYTDSAAHTGKWAAEFILFTTQGRIDSE